MNRHFTRRLTPAPRRGGAVIIVVLSLLSLMLFLGVFFFEFATEEQQNSEYYAGANVDDVVNPETVVTEALEQVIVGPRRDRLWSVLAGVDTYLDTSGNSQSYGNVHSMLAHVLGPIETGSSNSSKHGRPMDVIPHNGRGIRVIYGPNASYSPPIPDGAVRFDHDGDGVPDSTLLKIPGQPASPVLLGNDPSFPGPEFAINFSRMAQPDPNTDAFNQPTLTQRIKPYVPDTDYTQADINTLFLAHEEFIGGRRVFVPSFFRPTMFPASRDSDGNGAQTGGGAGGFANLFTAASTARKVLRPHRDHVYPTTPGTTRRYLTAVTTAQSGDLERQIGAFPFTNDLDNDSISNEMGIYTSAASVAESNNYELDVDVDGDGDYDGFWMDLGLGVVDLPDGRQYVPLVSFLILDADGLGNVNVHGNIQGLRDPAFSFDSYSVSTSNMGLGPQEVNLMRLFTGNPFLFSGSDLRQAQSQYGAQYAAHAFSANLAQSPLRLANMDAIFLLSGRRQIVNYNAPRSPIAGRFGEEQQLLSNVFPRGGITGQDDDGDSNTGSLTFDGGRSRTETLYDPKDGNATGVTVPPYVHPLSLSGHGADSVVSNGSEQRDLLAPTAGNPSVWPPYSQFYDDPGAAGAGVKPMSMSDHAALMTATGLTTTLDEENEAIAAHDSRNRAYDSLFEPSENVFLQASDSDYQRSNARTRLEQLLPFSLRSARDAADIRKRLTTDSWDLNQLTYVNLRANESNAWLAPPNQNRKFFPPLFGGQSLSDPQDPLRPELRTLLATETATDTTQLGTQGSINTAQIAAGRTLLRQQLNINRLLVGFDGNNNPIYRNLMPHPDIVDLEYQDTSATMSAITIPAMIHDHNASPPVSLTAIQASPTTEAARATSATAQEWWARYDRQRLARDIYTLLYLTGATRNDNPAQQPYTTANYPDRRRLQGVAGNGNGNGNGNGSANGVANGVNNVAGNGITENVEEMAQFAVNFVDALDRDDVITTFEYDADLSDGWDSPSQKVYGVERQSLTISEALLWQLQRVTSGGDKTETLFVEENDSHQILHVELRNASPFTVEVGEGWRILRVPTNNATPDMWYSFKTRGFGTATASVKSVVGGDNFLISSRDPGINIPAAGATATSDLWANIDADPELECVVPRSTTTISDNQQTPAPKADIDLSQIGPGLPHDGYAQAGTPVGGYTGTLVQETTGADAPPTTFDIVLQRRQNLRGIASAPSSDLATESTGRWIEVDRFAVNSSNMGPNEGRFSPAADTATDIQNALTNLHSRERPQPFVPRQYSHPDSGTINHTLSSDAVSKNVANQALLDLGLTQFSIWQPHFDRDFSSIYELLSIPLYGSFPTADINTDYNGIYSPEVHGGAVVNLAKGDTSAISQASLSGDFTAGIRFLFPNGEPAHPYQGWNPVKYSNNWYRLFGFIQVPRRTEQADPTQYPTNAAPIVGAIKPLNRVPGLINLNTVRDEAILAALLDDNLHFPLATTRSTTNDQISSGRNWYTELRVSRDGVDAFMANAGLPSITIPGTMNPASPGGSLPVIYPKPFRPLGHVDLDATSSDDNGIESTVLRSRPTQFRPSGPQNSAADMTTVVPAGGNPWTAPAASLTDWQSLMDGRDMANNDIDFHTRNRILAKATNNSTTKSHVFFVWVAVGYFEAHETTVNGAKLPQIGARITDLPIHRVFSVVDMTRLEDAYDPYNRTFDYSKFVIHRKRLR